VANYPAIIHMRPEVRDFIRNRAWVHRGDVLTYGQNIRCDSFSTDSGGFRHSTFAGRTMSFKDCLESEAYGLVLGPSNVYGFGIAGNENTLPSLLADRFGFPFANIGMPEGNSRNLFGLLFALIARAPRLPRIVLHLSGGDFTSFCYTGLADPVFGPPNIMQGMMAFKERGKKLPPAKTQLRPLLAFSSLWIMSIGQLCRSRNIPFVLGEDTTFFEKAAPNEMDLKAELGRPLDAGQERQFKLHQRFVRDYHAKRRAAAEALDVPICGPGFGNSVTFVDEFHFDVEGARLLCEHFAAGIEAAL